MRIKRSGFYKIHGGVMKKCPYIYIVEQVNENVHEYNDQGLETFCSDKMIERTVLAQCLEKQCGAYFLGHCF